jgi:hypothetical protein
MAKTRNRHLIRGGKRLLATIEKNEAKDPALVSYKSVVQEFLEKLKAAKTRPEESTPAPSAAPAEAEPE